MSLSSKILKKPKLQDFWESIQKTKSASFKEVKATADEIGIPVQELLDWLNSKDITVLTDDIKDRSIETMLEAVEDFSEEYPGDDQNEEYDEDDYEEDDEDEEETEEDFDLEMTGEAEGKSDSVDEPLKLLLRMIRHNQNLTDEKEVALIKKAKKGDREAREKLIEANVRLVISIACSFSKRTTIPLEDLVQEGCLGLIKAVDLYDLSKGFKFSTYAFWWIKQYINRAISRYLQFISVPVYLSERIAQLKSSFHHLSQKLGREATVEELAKLAGMPADRLEEILRASVPPISLDTSVDNGEEKAFLEEVIPDPEVVTPEEAWFRRVVRNRLLALFDDLTEMERNILKLRFGFVDGNAYTLKEVGEMLKITGERVSHVEQRALAKLRRPRYKKILNKLNEMLTLSYRC